jgi:hypothetical protein
MLDDCVEWGCVKEREHQERLQHLSHQLQSLCRRYLSGDVMSLFHVSM